MMIRVSILREESTVEAIDMARTTSTVSSLVVYSYLLSEFSSTSTDGNIRGAITPVAHPFSFS